MYLNVNNHSGCELFRDDYSVALSACQPQALCCFSRQILQRNDPHTHQVTAVDPLIALRQYSFDTLRASKHNCLFIFTRRKTCRQFSSSNHWFIAVRKYKYNLKSLTRGKCAHDAHQQERSFGCPVSRAAGTILLPSQHQQWVTCLLVLLCSIIHIQLWERTPFKGEVCTFSSLLQHSRQTATALRISSKPKPLHLLCQNCNDLWTLLVQVRKI